MGWTSQFAKHFLKSVSEGITDQQERMRKKEDLEDERDWQLKTESRTEERTRAAEDRQFGRQKELRKIDQDYTQDNAKTQQRFALDQIEERHLNSLEQIQDEFNRKEELTKKERELLVTNIKIAATGLLKSENYGYTDEEIEFLLPHIEAAALAGDTNYATKFKKDAPQKPSRKMGRIMRLNEKGEYVPIKGYDKVEYNSEEIEEAFKLHKDAHFVPLGGATSAQIKAGTASITPGAGEGDTVAVGQDNPEVRMRGVLEGAAKSPLENVRKAAQRALDALKAGDPEPARLFMNSSLSSLNK